MRYVSLFSGIEAATQAWHSLGWSPIAFAEIEKFPASVLAYRYPEVPNLGDVTNVNWKEFSLANGPVDLVVFGSPCQSFSVAGKRLGMDDPRGNLALHALSVVGELRPRWFIFENVPGLLSSAGGSDFGLFLRSVDELGYSACWRVLDAQYVRTCRHRGAVPQRRRRVFVVGYLGDWRRAAAVLFDAESLSGNPPPRREAGQGAAPTLAARTRGGGGLGTDFDCDGGLIAAPVASTLDAHFGDKQGLEDQHVNQGCPLYAANALRGEGFDASEDGTGRGTPIVPVAYRTAGDGAVYEEGDVTAPLTTATDQNAQVVAIQERAVSENPNNGPDGAGIRQDGAAYTLEARTVTQAVAFDLRGREGGAMPEGPHDTANLRAASGGSSRSYVAQPWAVRRLTPTECHRLQGFPDGFCDIPWRGKDHAPDGPMYRALGNSMAVNVMEWIGRRIELVEGQ